MNSPKRQFDIARKKISSKKTQIAKFSFPKIKIPKFSKLKKIKFPKLDFSFPARFSVKKQTFFAKRLSFLIKAGESIGTLIQSLNYLADELKKKEILRKKIMSALLYPIIITIATFGITGLLIVYIFPKILPIFA